jgi:hypothetical protein
MGIGVGWFLFQVNIGAARNSQPAVTHAVVTRPKQTNSNPSATLFTAELQARRKRRDPAVPWSDRLISVLYGVASDYGNSVLQPIAYWFAAIFAFAVIYVGIDGVHQPHPYKLPTNAEFIEALGFSSGRALPFGPWANQPEPCTAIGRLLDVRPSIEHLAQNEAYKTVLANSYGPCPSFWVRVLASVQSLLQLVLAFLAALAARRSFQIN